MEFNSALPWQPPCRSFVFEGWPAQVQTQASLGSSRLTSLNLKIDKKKTSFQRSQHLLFFQYESMENKEVEKSTPADLKNLAKGFR